MNIKGKRNKLQDSNYQEFFKKNPGGCYKETVGDSSFSVTQCEDGYDCSIADGPVVRVEQEQLPQYIEHARTVLNQPCVVSPEHCITPEQLQQDLDIYTTVGLLKRVSPGVYKNGETYYQVGQTYNQPTIKVSQSETFDGCCDSCYPQKQFEDSVDALFTFQQCDSKKLPYMKANKIRDYLTACKNLPNLTVQNAVLDIIKDFCSETADPKEFYWGVEDETLYLIYKGEKIAEPKVSEKGVLTLKKLSGASIDFELPKFEATGDVRILDCLEQLPQVCTECCETGKVQHLNNSDVAFDIIPRGPQSVDLLISGTDCVSCEPSKVEAPDLQALIGYPFISDAKRNEVITKLRVQDSFEVAVLSNSLDVDAVLKELVKALCQEYIAAHHYQVFAEFVHGEDHMVLRDLFDWIGNDEAHDHARKLLNRISQLGGGAYVQQFLNPTTWAETAGVKDIDPNAFVSNDSVIAELIAEEVVSINQYQTIYKMVSEKDIVTADLVQHILADEQDHLYKLKKFC